MFGWGSVAFGCLRACFSCGFSFRFGRASWATRPATEQWLCQAVWQRLAFSRAFPKSIGGVGEPLRHNQPSGPSEFELGRGLPQELGRASIMEESAPLFYVCPRLRPRRGLHRRSGGDDDAGAPAASWPPLAAGPAAGGGQRRAPRSPPRRRRASHAPAGFAAGRSGCASDLGPLLGGQPDARDAGPAVSRCVCGL